MTAAAARGRITTLKSTQADILPCVDLLDRMRYLQHLAEMELPSWAEGRSVILYGSWVGPGRLIGCPLLDSRNALLVSHTGNTVGDSRLTDFACNEAGSLSLELY